MSYRPVIDFDTSRFEFDLLTIAVSASLIQQRTVYVSLAGNERILTFFDV